MRVLVDTSAWFALEVAEDRHHERAVDFWRKALPDARNILVSTWIFSETLTHLSRELGSGHAFRWGRSLLDSRNTEIVHGDAGLYSRALLLMQQRGDPKFSFADAASWVIAREHRVDAVFAFDRHLRIPGIPLLPGDEGWAVREPAGVYRAGRRKPAMRRRPGAGGAPRRSPR